MGGRDFSVRSVIRLIAPSLHDVLKQCVVFVTRDGQFSFSAAKVGQTVVEQGRPIQTEAKSHFCVIVWHVYGFAVIRPLTKDPRAWRDCCAMSRLASCSTNTSPRTVLPFSSTRAG